MQIVKRSKNHVGIINKNKTTGQIKTSSQNIKKATSKCKTSMQTRPILAFQPPCQTETINLYVPIGKCKVPWIVPPRNRLRTSSSCMRPSINAKCNELCKNQNVAKMSVGIRLLNQKSKQKHILLWSHARIHTAARDPRNVLTTVQTAHRSS